MKAKPSETLSAPHGAAGLAFASETTVQPSGALVEVGTVTYQGRAFAALGSVRDYGAGLLCAYVREIPSLYNQGSRYELTTWEGVSLCPVKLVRAFQSYGAVRCKLFAWRAVIDGRTYSGRNAGPGMFVRMRASVS